MTELVPESSMDAVTGMSGSGIAFVYQVIQALEDGGVAAGLSRDVASKFASQTALAAAKMIQQSDRDIQSLIDDVTSPAGTTYAGLQKANEMGLSQAVQAAVQETPTQPINLLWTFFTVNKNDHRLWIIDLSEIQPTFYIILGNLMPKVRGTI